MPPSIPESENDLEELVAESYGQSYGANPFSSKWWLENWKEFNGLVKSLIQDKSIGKYVVTTDIANFYDSIEVPRLINKIRHAAPGEIDTAEALAAFLGFWNRKHVGYMPSSKGIPQEIISDASRILAHFYLQSFDDEFGDYCDTAGLTFVRWSDDILVFGGSRQKLEAAIHTASKILRDLGLNLNASKTKYMSKSQLREYRALDLIGAISALDHKRVAKEVGKTKRKIAGNQEFRIDTVFRAMIGYVYNNPTAQTSTNKAFIFDIASANKDLLHSLNKTQMVRYIELTDKPKETFVKLQTEICKASFGFPKAAFLHMLRKHRNPLAKAGMTKAMALSAINGIEKASSDSDVIRNFCIPRTRDIYQ